MNNILILSSLGMHLKPLASRLRGTRKLAEDNWKTRAASVNFQDLYLCKIGPELEQARAATLELIEKYQPEHLFYLGLAGSLRQDIKVPSTFFVSTIKRFAGDSRELTINQAISLEAVIDDPSAPLITWAKGRARIHRATMLSVDSFSGGFQERRRLRKAGLDLLDTESGIVAEVALEKDIPFTCLMTVSDDTMEKYPLYDNDISGKVTSPPPRKVIKAITASNVLGSVAHMWLLKFCSR